MGSMIVFFTRTGGQGSTGTPFAVEHGFPHAAQQDIAAVVDDEPRHNNARQRRFAAVEHNAVDQPRQHRRDKVAGKYGSP